VVTASSTNDYWHWCHSCHFSIAQ